MKTTARIGISLTSAYFIVLVMLYITATIGDMIRATLSILLFVGLAFQIYKLIR
jgi:hypothetical protein